MRFVFIAAEKANFRVVTMCRVLRVARSGFYAWCKRGESTRARSAKTALVHIRATYRHHKARYGSPRVHRELCDQGLSIGRHRVARLMKSEGLYARQKRRFRKTTNSNHGFRLANNLVARHFEATAPNRIWLSDITYVYTREGWLYLVCFLDVHSRRIVGWDIDDTLDASSTCRALWRALAERRPSRNLVLHSDRGIQYASEEFRRVLRVHDITQSMSRKGDCWDNAPMESFWGTLKRELIEANGTAPRLVVHQAIADYIDYYNRERKHSTLDYVTPVEYESERAA